MDIDTSLPPDVASPPLLSPPPPKSFKFVVYGALFFLFILANYFLYSLYQRKNSPVIPPAATSPTPLPSPTVAVQKNWSSLKLSIQNGSGKTGYAGTIAAKFKDAGIADITTGNADRSDYSQSILIFSSQGLKDKFLSHFTAIIPLIESNIKIDTGQSFDAILILGIN